MVLSDKEGDSWFLQVVFLLLSRILMPRYNARIQFLKEQIEMLLERVDDPRIITTAEERERLIRKGGLFGHDINELLLVVKPDTYRGWLRKKAGKKPTARGGRPETDLETIQLILRLAKENLAWGYKRIHGKLKKLGIQIGLTTIRDIMKRNGLNPVPDKATKCPDLVNSPVFRFFIVLNDHHLSSSRHRVGFISFVSLRFFGSFLLRHLSAPITARTSFIRCHCLSL